MSNRFPTGHEFQEILGGLDVFSWGIGSPFFTAKDLTNMHRAQQGDFAWMYDKDGNPRAGWVRIWNDYNKREFIQHQKYKAYHKRQREEKRAEKWAKIEENGGQFSKRHPLITFLIFFALIGLMIVGAVGQCIENGGCFF